MIYLADHKLQKVQVAIACVIGMLQDYFNEEDDEDARRVPPRPSSPELHSEGVGRPFVKLRPGSPPSQRPPPRVSFLFYHVFSLHQSDKNVALGSCIHTMNTSVRQNCMLNCSTKTCWWGS